MANRIYLISILIATLFQPQFALAQKYVVGGDYDYAPFSFIDKTGKPSGLEIEVLEAIAALSDIKLDIQLSRWDSAISYIQSGRTDIIVGIIFSEERESFLDFTIPIHTEYYSIFIRKDLPFKDLSSLYDYKLVALDKDISIDKYLIPMGLFKNYVLAKSLPEALSVIELGLADYVIAPNLLGLNEIERNKYQNIEIRGPSIIPSIYCMAVRKGNTELLNILNNGLTELRRNGKLAEIQEKWKVYEEDNLKYRRIVRNFGIVFTIGIVLLVLVFIWVWLLRLQIKKKTESLHLKNQELQKSEEKFRVITENSSDIIWHLDSNFRLTYISPADERIRGFKKEEVIGKSLFSILKPEGIEMLQQANKKRMFDLSKGIRSAPAIYELEELCKDGSWIWVESTATAFYDSDGSISGYHGVSRDITERKKAEQLLKERETQLRELNATKDKLFSIIAHDLRSPFSAILGLSELLIEKHKDFYSDNSGKYLRIINSTSKNTLALLDNLLAWAKSQTGNNTFMPETTSLQAVINGIFEELKSIANIKNVTLDNVQTDDIEVYADVNMLKTILRNLVSNAIKFSHPHGKIAISAVKIQNNIEITVSDNGVGMSKDTLSKLFEIDSDISAAGTAGEKGSGFGLLLCKEFVEKHGGNICAKSELGKGCAFIFTLPFKK
ncbi:transporter substrate-binding domain-containing protein [Perlabentimonas gracilis]|uniref:transporter substrate-binding domain-containing protein n=1 Tax=Perlabentimonas gracilis TaxID=2715279 RepID=UPI00140A8329|nr:transporter substrate-binding domain-containing protein [Perlabentimonas gracilis]NHB68722.1 transporter substrate-binding domain-containing protein [Perlabentimonas gracilis]